MESRVPLLHKVISTLCNLTLGHGCRSIQCAATSEIPEGNRLRLRRFWRPIIWSRRHAVRLDHIVRQSMLDEENDATGSEPLTSSPQRHEVTAQAKVMCSC